MGRQIRACFVPLDQNQNFMLLNQRSKFVSGLRAAIIGAFLFCTSLLLTQSIVPTSALAQGSPLWQQRVEYDMEVIIDVDRHQMDGRQTLRYHNNSPDTLHSVFYHLYFNAFNPQSAMAERNRHLPDPDSRIVPRIFELGPDEVGYHRIAHLTQDGHAVDFRILDTVMEVELARPIPPGADSRFEMEFTSQIPLQTRRSGRDNVEGIDYSMTQWYPKMANYDERGWHSDPYIGREFYAPFGTFDVRITLPAEYVVGSTGVLQNPEEIGHGYGSTERGPAENEGLLTWNFHAEDVHDFAWAADPDYVHDIVEHDGIEHHLLYQPDVASNWLELRDLLPEIVEFFSEEFGQYPYPQVTVAQGGDGGMEYPMITLIAGRGSLAGLRSVTIHEIAHMWYYGIIGTNEADYAWLDEGFVTYTAAEFRAHSAGRSGASHLASQLAVLQRHDLGLFEQMNTPSDWFRTNSAYSAATYSAGSMVLDMLGYVISDSLRDRFLIEYFDRFKFRHPNPYDVEKVAEDVSGLRLDWFFEQLTNTTWTLDYAVNDVSSRREDGAWRTAISIERKGDIAIPIDLRLTYEDGSQQWISIPLGIMHGHKPVPDSWIVADPWIWTYPDYHIDLKTPQRVSRVEIDPHLRTPDINRLNNSSRFPIDFSFLEAPVPSMSRYSIGWRPLLQYADNFGFGGGIQFRGTSLFGQHRTRAMVKYWPEVIFSGGDDRRPAGRFSPGIDFELQYADRIEQFGPYGFGSLQTEKHLGILESEAAFTTPLNRYFALTAAEHRLTLGLLHQLRTTRRAAATPAAFGFSPDNMLSAHAAYSFSNERTRIELRGEVGGTVEGDSQSGSANKFQLDAARAAALGPFTAGARIRIGWGSPDLAAQKRFRLGEASYEDRWGNDAYRSIAAIFADPPSDPSWVAFEGPGPVAYARGIVDRERASSTVDTPAGSNVLAASAVLVAMPFEAVSWLAPLRAEVFAGAGSAWSGSSFFDGFSADRFLFDAGVGVRYDVSRVPLLRRWTAQSDVLTGLNLTAKFPVWASDTTAIDKADGFAFRWMLGVTIDGVPWY